MILTAVLIGYLLLFVLSIVCLVYTILAIVTVNKGEDYVVPFTIEIIK
ncbi:putative Tic20 family protein [Staphylococcus caledonicus]